MTDVIVQVVKLSPRGLALSVLENDKASLDRLILSQMRKIDQEHSRLTELKRRRDFVERAMHELVAERD